MGEIEEIKNHLAELSVELRNNNTAIDNLKDVMNGRIKALEVAEAKRQGRESVVASAQVPWGKIILGIIGLGGAAIGLATIVAQSLIGSQ